MKKIILIFLSFIHLTNFGNENNSSVPEQTAWTVLNVRGHSIDPHTGMVDDTEGFGAFDSIMKLFNPSCPYNFDNGGGAFDDTSRYAKDTYNIENVVYDPFMRTKEHNDHVLSLVHDKKFDCCTSISVLNVIDTQEARFEHIHLCYDVLKENGSAFFKVWPGDRSGVELKEPGRYQSNQDATYYLAEIVHAFGKDNVTQIDDKTIKAIKKVVQVPDFLSFEKIYQLSDNELETYITTIEAFIQEVEFYKDSLIQGIPQTEQYMQDMAAGKNYLEAIQDLAKKRKSYNENYTHRSLKQKLYDSLNIPYFPFALVHELGHAVTGKLLYNYPINIHLGANPDEVPHDKYKVGKTNFSIHSYNFSGGFAVGNGEHDGLMYRAAGSLVAIPFSFFIMKKAVEQFNNSNNRKMRIVSLIISAYSGTDLLGNIKNITPFMAEETSDGQKIWKLLGLPEPYLAKARLIGSNVLTDTIYSCLGTYLYTKYLLK